MPSPFSRSMRSLAADDGRAGVAGVAAAVGGLGLWAGWIALARIPVYEQSASARVESARAVFAVESPMAGQVVVNRMALDQVVRAGDPLVELDGRAEQLQENEIRSRADAIAPQLDAQRAQLAAAERAIDDGRRQTAAAVDAARARLREAETLSAASCVEGERADRLLRLGQGSLADAQRARSLCESRRDAAAALRLDLRRLDLEGRGLEDGRRAEVARLQGEVARLTGERATQDALLASLAHRTSRRVLRAPVDGRLGSVVELRPGSTVGEGQRLAAVVPAGELRVVAGFAPGVALGRVRAGQPARLRLDGYPWAQWGTVAAVVSRVGSEVRDGTVRVELALCPGANPRIALEHGLPGGVEVEVERVSPATLVLRAAGQLVSPR